MKYYEEFKEKVEKGEFLTGTGEFTHPAPGTYQSSKFGPRAGGFHYALDFAGPIDTPIVAADNGVIELIRKVPHMETGYGTYIIIDHGKGLKTLYAHMWQHQVKSGLIKGDKVKKGEPIGGIGDNGDSSGPHLHFEVRKDGNKVDPAPYLE
ncbi:M23 family metallopeptidase [Mechercharimyces sp. CAU 1602]|nr:M23 family metallopeptidase [Mechercharimyces sp. CAU 1602]